MGLCKVTFLPFGKTVEVEPGASLLESAGVAGIAINNLCGGDGVCGRCKMKVKEGAVGGDSGDILSGDDAGVVLSCRSLVEGDLVVEILAETNASERSKSNESAERYIDSHVDVTTRAIKKDLIISKIYMKLDPPSLDSNFADFERVEQVIEKNFGSFPVRIRLDILKKLPSVLRENDFSVTVVLARRKGRLEIIDVQGGDRSGHNYVLVVDIGTTTVVAHLVDTVAMTTVGKAACFNSQSVYGREVTARIMSAEKKGVESLQALVVEDINRLLKDLLAGAGADALDVNGVMCSGNTTMIHFLMGLPVNNIRRDPFIAAVAEPPLFTAGEVGIQVNPSGMIYAVPSIGSWVGGDLTAGILASGLHKSEKTAMLIDVGTNGEVIVGNSEWLMACSASTGPALEGASVECGMMGEKGAIERVTIIEGEIAISVIGACEPRGICGSGIIDLVAVLLDMGVIDRSGRFVEGSHSGLTMGGNGGRFILPGTEIYITQVDIDNIVTAKAAVFAAAKIMLDRLNLCFADIEHFYLAGGFGGFINIENALKIGLLPGLPISRIQYVGNTSLYGAKLAAFSAEVRNELHEIRSKTTYYDLMGSVDYVEQFKQAQFLPHTDMSLFAGTGSEMVND